MKRISVLAIAFLVVFGIITNTFAQTDVIDAAVIATTQNPGGVEVSEPQLEPIQVKCFAVEKKLDESRSFMKSVDDGFGVIVNVLAKVLFFEPFSAQVLDKNGNPVMTREDAKDKEGKDLSEIQFLIAGQDKPVYDESGVACLNAKGEVQKDDNGRPYLTKWGLTGGQFVHSKAFINQDAKYLKKDSGEFFQKTSKLEVVTKTPKSNGVPLVVLILMFGAIFYTIYYRFVNFTMFKHAIDCVRGVFDNPDDPGEISHFQALTSALSATVGLGNIAGVAVAIGIGGPGAVFWMILLGLLGMTSKFHECTLGQLYRKIDDEGRVHGGPMYYLNHGFAEMGYGGLGKVIAFIFALFIIGGSFGAGNMFQANQSFKAIAGEVPAIANYGWAFGLILAFLVGLVIIGGIKRIGTVTEKLIPIMCGIYLVAALYVIATYFGEIPRVIGLIFSNAFNFDAGIGGFVGIAVQGIRRAVFSNEAGAGSAAIAHSCAKTDEPVREGLVSLLEPFIDTVVICTMTAFVVLVTGAYDNPIAGEGVEMTRYAFGTKLTWFPTILSVCVLMFAFSTMISWSYYGEQGWTYFFGYSKPVVTVYRLIFLFFVVLGSMTSLGNVLDFSDFMFLSMVFPNILGGIWLSKKVKTALDDYTGKLRGGKFARYK